jgi:hypothetical protein
VLGPDLSTDAASAVGIAAHYGALLSFFLLLALLLVAAQAIANYRGSESNAVRSGVLSDIGWAS